jgi:hypothetical protein
LSLKAVHYHGGRIHYRQDCTTFRVYKRCSDRVESRVKVEKGDASDQKFKFSVACAMIEDDSRPVE